MSWLSERGGVRPITPRKRLRNISTIARTISSELPLTRKARGSGDILLKKSRGNLKWRVEVAPQVLKEIESLERVDRERIGEFLTTRIEGTRNPRLFGEPVSGESGELWLFRAAGMRILCLLNDEKATIAILRIGPRRQQK